MKRRTLFLTSIIAVISISSYVVWGFYGHREINRLAVFTMPSELAGFYKRNQIYVSTHAVDPDKRRYAASLEGPRHFIDMERFGDGTVDALPLEFWDFHDTFTGLYCITASDSLEVSYNDGAIRVGEKAVELRENDYKYWYKKQIFPSYRKELTTLNVSLPGVIRSEYEPCIRFSVFDTMMQHGVLPYHMEDMQSWLTTAFKKRDTKRILQLSAEIGHYIGDATVPLHTTTNYNGQETGQRGIHAFWESRIPELFAEAEFDMLVGKANYIIDKPAFFRGLVRTSHEHVDSVLLIEADLRRKLPEAEQECYEERLGRIVRVPCTAFTRAYYNRLDGMVEERFRVAINAVGSSWYTAWVDAGRPAMDGDLAIKVQPKDTIYTRKEGLNGREH
ncbi:MAG: zinc dependent phospholipase C family protein [Saprospiraceae bacterium]